MVSPAVAELQAQVNRIAGAGQFKTIPVDGEMGGMTAIGVGEALVWITKDGCTEFLTCPTGGLRIEGDAILSSLINFGMVDQDRLTAQAGPIANYLKAYADAVGLAPGPPAALQLQTPSLRPVPIGAVPPKPKVPGMPPAASSFWAGFQHRPAWQQAGIGAIVILGGLTLVKHFRKPSSKGGKKRAA